MYIQANILDRGNKLINLRSVLIPCNTLGIAQSKMNNFRSMSAIYFKDLYFSGEFRSDQFTVWLFICSEALEVNRLTKFNLLATIGTSPMNYPVCWQVVLSTLDLDPIHQDTKPREIEIK